MASAFISYSRKDKEITRRILDALRERETDIWIDWEDIPLASDWLTEVHKGIENSDAFIFILSPNSIQSKVCTEELEHAQKNGKRLIPVVVHDLIQGEVVPADLASISWIYIRENDDFDAGLNQLIVALETDYEWVSFHSRLQVRALEWERKGRNNSFLLQGADLEEAETALATSINRTPPMTALQAEFINTGRRSSIRRQRQLTLAVTTLSVFFCLIGYLLGRYTAPPESVKSMGSGTLVLGAIGVLSVGALAGYLSRNLILQNTPTNTVQPERIVEEPDALLAETVFISYNRDDWDKYVKPLVVHLRAKGYKVWIDQNNIEASDNWMDELNKALETCQRLILCVSPDSLDSKWVKMEYRYFISHEKTIFPLILEKAKMPAELLQLQSTSFAQLGVLTDKLRNAGRAER